MKKYQKKIFIVIGIVLLLAIIAYVFILPKYLNRYNINNYYCSIAYDCQDKEIYDSNEMLDDVVLCSFMDEDNVENYVLCSNKK